MERQELLGVARRGLETLIDSCSLLRLDLLRVAQSVEEATGKESSLLSQSEQDIMCLTSALRRTLIELDATLPAPGTLIPASRLDPFVAALTRYNRGLGAK